MYIAQCCKMYSSDNGSFMRLNFFFWNKVSCSTGCPGKLCVVEGDLEFMVLLPPPPQYWDYEYKPPFHFLCGSVDQTQGFMHVRQALNGWNYFPSPRPHYIEYFPWQTSVGNQAFSGKLCMSTFGAWFIFLLKFLSISDGKVFKKITYLPDSWSWRSLHPFLMTQGCS